MSKRFSGTSGRSSGEFGSPAGSTSDLLVSLSNQMEDKASLIKLNVSGADYEEKVEALKGVPDWKLFPKEDIILEKEPRVYRTTACPVPSEIRNSPHLDPYIKELINQYTCDHIIIKKKYANYSINRIDFNFDIDKLIEQIYEIDLNRDAKQDAPKTNLAELFTDPNVEAEKQILSGVNKTTVDEKRVYFMGKKIQFKKLLYNFLLAREPSKYISSIF
jgi:hypothetical protein